MKKLLSPASILLLILLKGTISQAAGCEPRIGWIPLPYSSSKATGLDKQLQYNDNGLIGGAEVYYDKDTGRIGIGIITPAVTLDVNGNVSAGTYFGDGSNLTGISAGVESDPTVPASIKDGINWTEISDRPVGLDDGDDVGGITIEADPTVPESVKDGVSWTEISDRPSGLDDGDDVGITTETDPKVGSNSTGYVPMWDGSSLVKGSIHDNGDGNIGIGVAASSSYQLHVVETTTTSDRPAIYGVHDVTDNWGVGVRGKSRYRAVWGESSTASGSGYGVYGYSSGAGTGTRYGVYGYATGGATAWAGYFSGNVNITGTLSKGAGAFRIDHPQDPANKYLMHSFVESPEMKNVYDGTIVLDTYGKAIINLPQYFEALNKNFRYQLTAVGVPAPNLHIAKKIQDNHFAIAGGIAGMEVCWQVTGVRKDRFAQQNPIVVETEKSDEEKGKYLHPELYNQTDLKGIHSVNPLQK